MSALPQLPDTTPVTGVDVYLTISYEKNREWLAAASKVFEEIIRHPVVGLAVGDQPVQVDTADCNGRYCRMSAHWTAPVLVDPIEALFTLQRVFGNEDLVDVYDGAYLHVCEVH